MGTEKTKGWYDSEYIPGIGFRHTFYPSGQEKVISTQPSRNTELSEEDVATKEKIRAMVAEPVVKDSNPGCTVIEIPGRWF